MTSKLYPPSIEGTLPAFTGNKIIVPISWNPSVSKLDTTIAAAIRIKTVQSNTVLVFTNKGYFNSDQSAMIFNIESKDLKIGQFYKIQVAYVKEIYENGNKVGSDLGYFSTIGIAKYTAAPKVYIDGLKVGEPSGDIESYLGKFETKDTTEKVYSYCFNFYEILDTEYKLIYTSEEQLHNHELDTEINASSDVFELPSILSVDKVYAIEYVIKTINGLEKASPKYKVIRQTGIFPEIPIEKIAVKMNKDNGYVSIELIDKDSQLADGSFQIMRASEIGEYLDWVVIKDFQLKKIVPSVVKFKDFTVEQGKRYKYAIRQYHKRIYSEKFLSEEIFVDFEDSFLYDGERQLKIKFDPKVSSFKTNVTEAKLSTLGEKYPFIFRNGVNYYNEFPINGLISYHMDNDEMFLKSAELGLTNTWARSKTASPAIGNKQPKTTDLVDYNFAAERIFKMKVLEFLNDGKPKLFRSPGEGNFIVRLMNSSLAPNDTVGRMLHTFSTTAIEVADCTTKELETYGIINNQTKEEFVATMWSTILIKDLDFETPNQYIKVNKYVATSFQATDLVPGSILRLMFAEEDTYKDIIIGSTGSYFCDFGKDIISIEVNKAVSSNLVQGQITYSYNAVNENIFEDYEHIEITNSPVFQVMNEYVPSIKNKLEDFRTKIVGFDFIRFYKNEEGHLSKLTYSFSNEEKEINIGSSCYTFLNNEKIAVKDLFIGEGLINKPNIVLELSYKIDTKEKETKTVIFELKPEKGAYISAPVLELNNIYDNPHTATLKWANYDNFVSKKTEIIDGEEITIQINPNLTIEVEEGAWIFFNRDEAQKINLYGEDAYYEVPNPLEITDFSIPKSVIAEMGLQKRIIRYEQELTDEGLKEDYNTYLTNYKNVNKLLLEYGYEKTISKYSSAVEAMDSSYSKYVTNLQAAVESED